MNNLSCTLNKPVYIHKYKHDSMVYETMERMTVKGGVYSVHQRKCELSEGVCVCVCVCGS